MILLIFETSKVSNPCYKSDIQSDSVFSPALVCENRWCQMPWFCWAQFQMMSWNLKSVR